MNKRRFFYPINQSHSTEWRKSGQTKSDSNLTFFCQCRKVLTSPNQKNQPPGVVRGDLKRLSQNFPPDYCPPVQIQPFRKYELTKRLVLQTFACLPWWRWVARILVVITGLRMSKFQALLVSDPGASCCWATEKWASVCSMGQWVDIETSQVKPNFTKLKILRSAGKM